MPTFDGDNLVITLDSGVTEIDVIDNIYEPWKDWMLASPVNRKYPQAFASDGGNPLSSIINQGSYIFLQNQYGWRIRPPEEDITIYLTGNLAVGDTTLPAFVPTVGAFTAAILGLQPVTQGVTEAMGTQLELVAFDGSVTIDTVGGQAGTGLAADGNPIGTRGAPSNNIDDGHTILMSRGLDVFSIAGDLTITTTDLSHGHKFIGDSPFISVTAQAGADVTGCSFENLTIVGEMDGINTIERCNVGAVTNINGFMEKSALSSTVSMNNNLMIMECYSAVPGTAYPIITVTAGELILRDYHGSVGISGITTGDHSIEVYGGRVVLNASCTGGNIYIRGGPYEVVDNSVGATVINQTDSEKIDNMHKADFNKRKHDSVANTITLYEADNVTPFRVFDATDDLKEITPQ